MPLQRRGGHDHDWQSAHCDTTFSYLGRKRICRRWCVLAAGRFGCLGLHRLDRICDLHRRDRRRAHLEGPIVGVFLLWGLVTYLAQYGTLYLVVLGRLAILIMLFMPRGMWGVVARHRRFQLFPSATLAEAA